MALIDHILRAYDVNSPAVLGTVVDLRGSGYRRPGARMLIGRSGDYIGAISGGCLEKDAARHALAWVEDGPQTVEFDTRSSRFEPLGAYGTGCEGILQLLLQPLPAADDTLDPLHTISQLRRAGRDGVLVTAYSAHTRYRGPLGAVALASEDDMSWAPSLPDRVRDPIAREAREALVRQQTRGLRLDGDPSELRLLLEYVRPPVELVVFGTGRDALALTELAEGLDWRIRVVGPDPLLLDDRFPGLETTCFAPGAGPDGLSLSSHSYVVVMSHNFKWDAAVMPHILDSDAPYIGLLGPKRRSARLLAQLQEHDQLGGADSLDQVLQRLAAPVGLDLGGDDPYEVALSILAEVVAAKNNRSGGALSDRDGSIHDAHPRVAAHLEER